MSSEPPDVSGDDRLSPTVCHLCRQRKTKCDRKLPRCGFCIKAKVACRYVERPKKRGLRAGYVSELEARLEIVEQEIEELKGGTKPVHDSPETTQSVLSPSQPVATPASVIRPPPLTSYKPREGVSNDDAAVRDMMTLPNSFYAGQAELWFKETQTWVPILCRDHINGSLAALPSPVNKIDDIELRAVVALTISYSTQAICLGYIGRRRLSRYLRSQVLVEAMSKPSMSSLRALLIISILDYGTDDIPSTHNLLAICRRMSENIGTFRQLLLRIESEPPAEVGPPPAGTPKYGDAIPLTWCILGYDAVSTLGVSWRDVSAALVDHLSSIAFLTSPDFRDSFRTHAHLAAIGLQPVHEFFSSQARFASPVADLLGACEEMYQNLISYVDGLPDTSYTLLPDGAVDFDICQIFTRVLTHGVVIMIYQRFIWNEEENVAELAKQRCLTSTVALVETIRNISDADTEIHNSPVVATFIYIATRFKLAYYRALGQPREALLDVLMHGINMLARRWPYARRLDIVLRAAIIEVDSSSSIVPAEFWELQKSHLDISESLKEWVRQHRPSLYIGNLDGPYV